MNGYYARVQRRRRLAAEQAARVQQAAVSNFDWVCAPLDGIADAVQAAVPHCRLLRRSWRRPTRPRDQTA